MRPCRLVVLFAIVLLLIQTTNVLAAGFATGPATLTVHGALRGSQQEETIFVKYTGTSDQMVGLRASGEITQWVSFYGFQDLSTPKDKITAINGQWTYATVVVQVPADRAIGPARGQLQAITEPQKDSEESVRMSGQIDVLVQVTARKAIPMGSNTVPLSQELFDFSNEDAKVGRGAVSFVLEVENAPANAALDVTVMRNLPRDIRSILEAVAEQNKYEIMGTAYMIGASRVNLEASAIKQAKIQLKVGRAWADLYGVDSVRIFKVGESPEFLDTTFVGYEGDSAVFEAVGNGDFSHFILLAINCPESDINWSLVGAILGGILPLVLVSAILLRRRRVTEE